jgi:hypothetical protein
MPGFDTDAFTSESLSKSKDLAATLFKKYVTQAESDTSDFLQRSKDGVTRAGLLYAENKIDRDDFEDLILGKKDLAEMHALKQAGLASATIDTFTNGVLQIVLDAAFTAVKF